jgi:hypothetical protein
MALKDRSGGDSGEAIDKGGAGSPAGEPAFGRAYPPDKTSLPGGRLAAKIGGPTLSARQYTYSARQYYFLPAVHYLCQGSTTFCPATLSPGCFPVNPRRTIQEFAWGRFRW